MATFLAIDPESNTNNLLGVCTSESECLELIENSTDSLLIFISGRLDDGSGISLVKAIHDQEVEVQGQRASDSLLGHKFLSPSRVVEAVAGDSLKWRHM